MRCTLLLFVLAAVVCLSLAGKGRSRRKCRLGPCAISKLTARSKPCRAKGVHKAFYYDPVAKKCRRVCLRRFNRHKLFPSRRACRKRCGSGRPFPTTTTTEPSPPSTTSQHPNHERCSQPMEVGPCDAHVDAWFYDRHVAKCVHFVYGGCQGNDNRFESKEACEETCDGVPQCPIADPGQLTDDQRYHGCQWKQYQLEDGCFGWRLECPEECAHPGPGVGAPGPPPYPVPECEMRLRTDSQGCPRGEVICTGGACADPNTCEGTCNLCQLLKFDSYQRDPISQSCQLNQTCLNEFNPCSLADCAPGHRCKAIQGEPVCMQVPPPQA